MSQVLKQVLLRQRKQSQSEFVVAKKEQSVRTKAVNLSFSSNEKESEIGSIHFHQLRHTFATRCLESKGDIMSVSALMGHGSTQKTLDTYASSLMEQQFQVVAQMEKAIVKRFQKSETSFLGEFIFVFFIVSVYHARRYTS